MAGADSEPNPGGDETASVTPMDRVRWAREIARMRNAKPRPKTWRQIAKATGMSEASCKRLHAQLLRSGDPDAPDDAMQWIYRRLDALTTVMDEASQTYEAAPTGSAVRVGALKLFNQASEEILDLAARVGFVPRQLGAVSAERQLQQVFRQFAELAQQHGASDDLLRGLLELAESKLAGGRTIEGRALPAA